jgi:hypothetical protein
LTLLLDPHPNPGIKIAQCTSFLTFVKVPVLITLLRKDRFYQLVDLLQYVHQSQEDMSGGIVLHDEVGSAVVLEAARDRHSPAVLWIRIRIWNADPDPGAWKLTKICK